MKESSNFSKPKDLPTRNVALNAARKFDRMCVRNFVAENGEIAVESVAGRGATFVITLPAYVSPSERAEAQVETQLVAT